MKSANISKLVDSQINIKMHLQILSSSGLGIDYFGVPQVLPLDLLASSLPLFRAVRF